MAFLSDSDRKRIEAAIREVERQTSGELVAVIARASDGYNFLPLLYATIVALAVPLVVWLVWLDPSPVAVYEIQIAAFAATVLLLRVPRLRMLVVPGSVKRARARRLARELFYRCRLHETEGRSGVLFFVSVAERYVEILADRGINERVPEDTWSGAVATFTAEVRAGRITEGFLGAIAACGAQLVAHFPHRPDDRNELPDVFVEI